MKKKIFLKSDEKVLRAIKCSENWLNEHKDYSSVNENFNFTIAGCERRNLEEYKEILSKNKRKLSGRLRELYQSI